MSKAKLRIESLSRSKRTEADVPVGSVSEDSDQKQLELGGAWESVNWDSMRTAARDRFGIEIAEDDSLKLMVYLFSIAMQNHWQAVSDDATGEITAVVKKFREQADEISETERGKFREQLIELGARLGGLMHVQVDVLLRPLKEQIAEIREIADTLKSDNTTTRIQYFSLGAASLLAAVIIGVFAGILFGRFGG